MYQVEERLRLDAMAGRRVTARPPLAPTTHTHCAHKGAVGRPLDTATVSLFHIVERTFHECNDGEIVSMRQEKAAIVYVIFSHALA